MVGCGRYIAKNEIYYYQFLDLWEEAKYVEDSRVLRCRVGGDSQGADFDTRNRLCKDCFIRLGVKW